MFGREVLPQPVKVEKIKQKLQEKQNLSFLPEEVHDDDVVVADDNEMTMTI